jgi:hypothetical protein
MSCRLSSVTLLQPVCKAPRSPHFSRLTEASIVIQAPVFPAIVSMNNSGDIRLLWRESVPFTNDGFSSDSQVVSDLELEAGTEVWLIPIAFSAGPFPQFEGIIVKRAAVADAFERIGHFQCSVPLPADSKASQDRSIRFSRNENNSREDVLRLAFCRHDSHLRDFLWAVRSLWELAANSTV